MRGDRSARDTRHNKDHENLKSSLKRGNKSKKHRVVFDESANEFFEADYIIVVRDECSYSDEGEGEECSGCGACERYQEPEPGALSPPEGYKDMGLFNLDGTLREQAWWEAGDVLLVGERSGTVFTPQHLQLLRRLQRERMLRSTICADCDAHAALHQPLDMEYSYEEEETSDVDRELRPVARRTAKHIAAGEERPRINSSQQTTPIDECPTEMCIVETQTDLPAATLTSEESDTAETEGRLSSENSPLRQRRGGILKGGRLWKSLDTDKDLEQNEDQRSITTASDDDGAVTPRSVRFVERPKEVSEEEPPPKSEVDQIQLSDNETSNKDQNISATHRLETPLILTIHAPKANSAVQQLFNSGRPPPPAIEPQLVTSETLRAWDAGVRPKAEDAAVRRVAERNALRCLLLRSEARKKQQPKQETTSLSERIRLLTCDVEEEPEEQRSSPAGASSDKLSSSSDKSSEKSYNSIDKNNEKAFGSASSSSSSSTLSAPMPSRQQPPDLGDVYQEPQKPRPEPRRQFLSTLAPLTACVGSTAHHEGFYYVPPGERTTSSSATNLDFQEHNDAPAPDVVAGTPGAGDGDDGLAAFARATAPRTERIKQRYGQESQPVSSDDEHDDYGFHRRPAVRGIAIKQQLGAADEILQQMQNELQPSPSSTPGQIAGHACQRSNSNYSWPYYSEANLNSRPQSRASANSNWSKSSDYVTSRQCSGTPVPQQHSDACYAHAQNMATYAHYQQRQQENMYRTCSLYANIGCSDSSQELYSSQTSSEQTSPVRSASRCRRPESPPPIRSHHQLLYVPYNSHYHYQHHDYGSQWNTNDYNRMHQYYQQQQGRSGSSTPQPTQVQSQRAQYSHALQVQTLCPVPARYRSVPAPQPGGGKQMICFSEKVAAPLYQPAPGSPSRAARGAPEGAPAGVGAPTATSPMAPPPNPVYYAMNV
ncbi:hypothetical protein K1T71_000177 [Dendrolimus kikuchii]|uniref:Uncharacterized protein n=1 Tax=Dendrolimus kikuchii TaxID=765133 RepID=A0ACC1DIF0_9NEOP|nr:hypothetical protein K1T71_000177 [Dendrolimus kikuchii]